MMVQKKAPHGDPTGSLYWCEKKRQARVLSNGPRRTGNRKLGGSKKPVVPDPRGEKRVGDWDREEKG